MAIRESALNVINSIATSDFVRAVTSAGASSKVTVSNLAKAVVENYNGSSLGGSARTIKAAIDDLQTATNDQDVVKVYKASVASLPTTISDEDIKANHEVINAVLSNPNAQAGDWTVTTSAGSAVISGSISGTTDITLYLAVPR